MDVLRLVDAVGIDEERLAVHVAHLFARKLNLGPEADRRIGFHLHILAIEQRGIMSGIAELHVARLQVDQSDEHRDEHALVVVLGQRVVQAVGDRVGRELTVDKCAEHTGNLGHEESRGHALAANVAHAEVEQVVDQCVAIEVAAHLSGGSHHRVEVDILALGEDVGQHALLYLAGDAQLALDALLGLRSLLKLVVGLLQLRVHRAQRLHVRVAAISVEGEEADDDGCDGSAGDEHRALLGNLLRLGVILGIGDGELGVKLVHLRAGLRRLDGVDHRTGALLPVEGLLPVAHMLVDRGFLGTHILLVDKFVGTLQGQLPLLAVLGLINVDELAEESALAAVLGDELGALAVGLLEAEAVALVVARQALVAPRCDLVHRDDTGLLEGLAGILLHILVVLTGNGGLAESEIAGRGALLGQVFLLQLQRLEIALLGQALVARLLADGAQGEGGEVHADVAVVLPGVMVDVVGQLDALLTVDVLEHIDRLVAARAIVGLLILGELGGLFHILNNHKEIVSLTRTIGAVGLVGERLELRGEFLFGR